jgi:hypothetical protein
MSDRRRAARFMIADPPDGHIRVLQDVVVERVDPEELVVMANMPSVAGEQLAVIINGSHGPVARIHAQTVTSTPVFIGERVRYRLHLAARERVLADIRHPEAR